MADTDVTSSGVSAVSDGCRLGRGDAPVSFSGCAP